MDKTELIKLTRDFVINDPAYKSPYKEKVHIRNYDIIKNNPELAKNIDYVRKNYEHVGRYPALYADWVKDSLKKFGENGYIHTKEKIEKAMKLLEDDEKIRKVMLNLRKEKIQVGNRELYLQYPKIFYILPKDIETIEENRRVIETKPDSYFKELAEKNIPVKTHRYLTILKAKGETEEEKIENLRDYNTYIIIPEVKDSRDLRDALIGIAAGFNALELPKQISKDNDARYLVGYPEELPQPADYAKLYLFPTDASRLNILTLRKPRWEVDINDLEEYFKTLKGEKTGGDLPLFYSYRPNSKDRKIEDPDLYQFLDGFIGLKQRDLYFSLDYFNNRFIRERTKNWLRAKFMYELASKTKKYEKLKEIGFEDFEDIEFYKKIFEENYKYPLEIDSFLFSTNIKKFDEQQLFTNLNYAADLLSSVIYNQSYKNIDLPVFYAVDFTKYMLPIVILPFEKPETSERILNILFSKGNREEKIQAFKEVLYKEIFKDEKSAEEFAKKAMNLAYIDVNNKVYDYFEFKDFINNEIMPLFKEEYEKYANLIALYMARLYLSRGKVDESDHFSTISTYISHAIRYRTLDDISYIFSRRINPLKYKFHVDFNTMFGLDDVMEEFFKHKLILKYPYAKVLMYPKFKTSSARRKLMKIGYPYRGVIETLDAFANNLDDVLAEFKNKQKYAPINTLRADPYLLCARNYPYFSMGLEPFMENLQYLIYESMKDQYAKYKDVVLKNYL